MTTARPTPRLPLRPELAGETPYGAPQLDVPVLLNVNENPYAPPAAVVAEIADAVTRAAHGLNRYPDRDFRELRGGLAAYLTRESGVPGLDADHLWAANGSNEVMLHLLQAFAGPGRTAVSFAPTYSMYPEYARDTFTGWIEGRRRDDFTLDVDHVLATIAEVRPAVVLLASPNNPTGTALALAEVERVLAATSASGPDGASTVVVVDEAYAEFRRPATPSALELLADHPYLAVTRTMSKAFALAGARVGYLAAAPALVDALRVVRLPYHLSAVTQAVALAALRHTDTLLGQVAVLREERDSLVTWLRGKGLDAADSDANFVLFGTFEDRERVWQSLLDAGVLIRVVGPPGWLRVSVGTPQENAAFRAALEEVLEP
ncbi:histidinol-phosphate aminotransferase [Beutenbergia cavernae DSM 12333]|uniref:Histidinol-phosphate aminotransferase n=1 Tax=Beutenbergia cavernae (strain ATCC BAA-8 / DSM 12333 / CCUG 43141 / JCM 11478 / NBRC 16432 / NCIMB 13614 / HKI 0122) TaxID=471853 RepID=C5BW42_BEUC1|nr:histidinol-phosphate transaminase [Beutenbergia cavernae]ACQ80643.1 histidinol-phosphate aminotransferase [Beutenbergia cavernae DSM 12333]